ncbi:MAG: 16S rRNA (guanine(966)-N(2))-methyltransferase RsmD [Desulfocapsa sp.]|nr:16S rRNA (guanine(966)-N(2))-methyltransferase RsmD [Desulfocapsa sp.]
MRIISGYARGRKLFTPGNTNIIRPTTDRAREALFSIIGHKIIDARVLDLYAGTGALGLESLSRGATQAIFIDKHQKSLELIQKNYALCFPSSEETETFKATIIKHDLNRGLNLQDNQFLKSINFDIVFLDPPYEKGLAQSTLKLLAESALINAQTLIIAEESSGQTLPDLIGSLTLIDQRRYGDTGFWFYKVQSPSPSTIKIEDE